MPRENKKTRAKGLPPKLQLQTLDAITGSFPNLVKVPSDNRTGQLGVQWDDTKTIVFQQYSNLELGIGINSGSQFINYSTEQLTNITTTGSLRKGVGDQIAHFTSGQDLTPFRDSDNPAVDGKSIGNPFYATGSKVEDVGEGFDQPLWSKSKIEIDMDAVSPATIGYRSGSGVGGDDYAMMYYNAGTKTYMPVGSRKRWDEYQDASESVQTFLEEKAVGFLPSMVLTTENTDQRYMQFTPTSMFGFPHASKYFVNPTDSSSSSILIPASNYISEPFLLEKIVVSFSCSHFARDWSADAGGGLAHYAINTFFILNQRRIGKISTNIKLSGSNASTPNINFNLTSNHQTGAMDVVTFNQFMFVGDTLAHATGAFPDSVYLEAQLSKEIQPIFVQDLYPGDNQFKFTGSLNLSGNIITPTMTMPNNYNSLSEIPTVVAVETPSGTMRSTGFVGGRNGIFGNPNTRNLNRTLEGIAEIELIPGIGINKVRVPSSFARTPYVLQPDDQLIFGWQCAYPIAQHSVMSNPSPFMTVSAVYIGPELTINAGPAKVTLYGSQIQSGKESHDTLNQLLSSNVVHETIG